jgi:hypothetical protein
LILSVVILGAFAQEFDESPLDDELESEASEVDLAVAESGGAGKGGGAAAAAGAKFAKGGAAAAAAGAKGMAQEY